ncbi:MAG: DNA methyltransferase [Anaerolineales bacterium]
MTTPALTFSYAQSLTIRIEGGLFSPDLLEALARAELPGQKPQDFGLSPHRSLTEEIASIYHDARAQWQIFQHRLERLPEDDPATSETRELWVIPLLRMLGYDLQYQPRALEVDGTPFPISHALLPSTSPSLPFSSSHALPPSSPALQPSSLTPIHIVSYRQELGRLAPSGRPRLSPHALVQEYLNRSESLWGLVTNGRTLRLLRDSTFIRRQAYVEFDLQRLFEEDRFADFVLLYRLLHRTRLPSEGVSPENCLLETYYRLSIEQGGRVREKLRDGVEQAIIYLANGFLHHPDNHPLRASLSSSPALPLSSSPALPLSSSPALPLSSSPALPLSSSQPLNFSRSQGLTLYKQLLRLIYRFLFLLVAEERGLMGQNPLYLEHYGIGRLRRLCEKRSAYTEDSDLWLGLRALWEIFRDEKLATLLGVPPLNGELFAHQDLDDALITNRDLLTAFWHLAFYDSPPRRVNYAALDTEELGSVYESLLDYHPVITFDGRGMPHFELAPGSERKSTGSYYTPPQLVSELVRSALEPVIEEKLRAAEQESERTGEHENSHTLTLSRSHALEKALLSIKVIDPACGSGHFLLAAARRLGKELARIRTGEDEPAPEQVRAAVRDVVAHCIYGVDKNPLAVELARVALWLESHAEGKPLTFLEHRIRHGDSLVGVFDLSVLKEGIPDEAFEPLEGDDRKLAAALKRQNKAEREGQLTLFGWNFDLDLSGLAAIGQELDAIPDDSPELVNRKRQRYESRWADPALRRQKQACDLWTAAFFQSFSPSHALPLSGSPITTDTVHRALAGQPVSSQTLAQAETLSAEAAFFHWPLEFPEVFAQGGFDVVLGNPPWEQVQLEEQEFFAGRNADIVAAPNAAARKRLIERLPQTNPAVWEEYRRALHTAESASRFLRGSGFYPLTGRGRINTYSVFAERMRALLAPGGRAGIILPTGIATDATNQYFFADVMEQGHLVSLYAFDNSVYFSTIGLHQRTFSLVTICQSRLYGDANFGFWLSETKDLRDLRRVFAISRADIARINPNTRTLPVFRTRQDADLTKAIYARVPVLVNEQTGENPWEATFKQGLFNMSSDSHLFRTRAELEHEGWRLEGNVFVRAQEQESHALPLSRSQYLPLYEAKMIWHYDHRFGTYAGVTDRTSTHLPTPDDAQHADPHFLALPWYWVPAEEVEARLGEWKRGWLLGFRDVTNATNERTAIFSLLPRVGANHKLPLVMLDTNAVLATCWYANVNSLALDFVTRQKIGGTSLGFFILRQLPVLPPSAYSAQDLAFIVPRVLELTYTAWDLAAFAADVWNEADDALRAALLKQYEEHESVRAREHEPPALPLSRSHPLPLSHSHPLPLSHSHPLPLSSSPLPFPPFRWDPARRALLRAELDAYYARLYGLTRKQLRYILDPADLTPRELEDILDPWEEVTDPLDPAAYAARAAASDFPSETFRVLKEKELREYGEYRTRRLVLQAWEMIR